jgi:tetratricopeptide (TPR) repeat protein
MMVMGSLISRRYVESAFLVALAFIALALRSVADDQITKTDGNVISGRIVGVSDGQVTVEFRTSTGGTGKIPYYISDIKSISMATPADVTKVQAAGVAPGTVIAALEPEVKQFAGLPVPWVVSAMAQLADAYTQSGQSDKALAIYNQVSQLYPGSTYENVAKAGRATLSLKAGKIDEALAAVQPIIAQADKDIAPSPTDGALYANAFLVRGQVYEAQKKPQQALEDYLTVKTMFYQNPALVAQAEQLAASLRDRNPGLGIE